MGCALLAARRLGKPRLALSTALDDQRWLLIGSFGRSPLERVFIERAREGSWFEVAESTGPPQPSTARPHLGTAKLEVRQVTRRQLVVDGQPVGQAFE